MGTATPWGTSDHKKVHARGVIEYSTPGHGGFHLSPTRNAMVHPALRAISFGGLGRRGWYEEDCDYAIVVVTFPELFEPRMVEAAVWSLRHFHSEVFSEVTSLAELEEKINETKRLATLEPA